MNANRRAALQRKLAVAPVPKPPTGLAAKIKSQIPKELRFSAERERARLTQSMRMSIAVAASVIVVIAVSYMALQITDRTETQPAATRPVTHTAPILQVPAAIPAPPPAAQKTEETRAVPHRARKQTKVLPTVVAEPPVVAEPQALDQSAARVSAAAAPAAASNIAISREAKIQVLKDELAKGADPKDIAKKARQEGLTDFADSLEKEKKKPPR